MKCFNCSSTENVEILHGYPICAKCKPKLVFFTEATVKKYVKEYQSSPYTQSYEEEINQRLEEVEKKYIKAKMKLLDIKEKIEGLK